VNWAIWAFIIPLVNFVAPRNLMVEIHEESEKLLEKNDIPFEWKITETFVTIWWTVIIVYRIFSNIIERGFGSPASLEEYQTFVILYMISSVLGLIFGVMSLKLIKSYMEAEILLNQVPDYNDEKDEEEVDDEPPIAMEPS
jgi:hypothetical protein